MPALADRTVFVSGGSRGIGLAIAKACAAQGANVVIAAKTDAPHPKLPGTIHSAAAEIEAAGGRCLPVLCDIREEAQVEAAVARAVEAFGRIDAVVNNASAISLTGTLDTPLKRYDLMTGVNSRGTYAVTRACLPWLLKAPCPHVLTLSPPLDLSAHWFAGHPAYSLAKYGMSPEIMADAAVAVLRRPVDFSGWFLLDDLVLAADGVTDFDAYAVTPGGRLAPDFFVPASAPAPADACGVMGWRAPQL